MSEGKRGLNSDKMVTNCEPLCKVLNLLLHLKNNMNLYYLIGSCEI